MFTTHNFSRVFRFVPESLIDLVKPSKLASNLSSRERGEVIGTYHWKSINVDRSAEIRTVVCSARQRVTPMKRSKIADRGYISAEYWQVTLILCYYLGGKVGVEDKTTD